LSGFFFSPYFSWKYFRVNALDRDHFTKQKDPLQTETTKVTPATSDSVDCCLVLHCIDDSENTMKNEYNYRLEILLYTRDGSV